MKDPLHTEPTPCEILDVGRGARKADVEKAFAETLRRGVAPNLAKAARDLLIGENKYSERVFSDMLLYDDGHLGRLRPSPLQDASVLDLAKRQETAGAWEGQLKESFPDLGITHSLGVLWYWWTWHEEQHQDALTEKLAVEMRSMEQPMESQLTNISRKEEISSEMEQARCGRADCRLSAVCRKEGVLCEAGKTNCGRLDRLWREACCSSLPPLEEMWRRVIAYWSVLAVSQEVTGEWSCASRSQAGEVSRRIENWLRNQFTNRVHKYSQELGAKHPLVLRYRQLEITLVAEMKTARTVAASGFRTRQGRLCAGVWMLRFLGLLEKMREQAEELLKRTPASHELQQLRYVLSEHFEFADMLDDVPARPEEVLRRIEALPVEQRASLKVRQLQGRAFLLLGRQEASMGQLDHAMDIWRRALDACPTEELRGEIQRDVVSTCRTQALTTLSRDPERAVAILENGLTLVEDRELKLTLADTLTRMAVAVFKKGQETLTGVYRAAVWRRVYQDFQEAKADLSRAAEMGSKNAAENLKVAESVLAQWEKQMPNGWLDLTDEAAELWQQATEAAHREQWDIAVEKLREALKRAGVSVPELLKDNLSMFLANRGVEKANQAIVTLNDVGKAHRDLFTSMTDKIERHHGLDDCSLCGRSKHTLRGGLWFSVTLAGGKLAPLCGHCAAQLRSLQESTLPPDAKAIALLEAAEKDLQEAATLNPSSDHIRRNRDALSDVLSGLPHGRAAPERRDLLREDDKIEQQREQSLRRYGSKHAARGVIKWFRRVVGI